MPTPMSVPVDQLFFRIKPGTDRHLLLQTKDSTIYVIDRDNMGKFHRDSDSLVQTVHLGRRLRSDGAYWNGLAFFAASDDHLIDYAIKGGHLVVNASSNMKLKNPGATPTVSADRNKNAIVWAITTR